MLRKVLLTALLLLVVSAAAHASTITVQFVGLESALTVSRTVDGTNFFDTQAGLFHFVRISGDYPTPTDIFTFCIEPREFTSTGSTVYTIDSLQEGPTNINGMGATKAQDLQVLYGQFWTAPFTSGLPALTAQALQIATWEIVREQTLPYNVLDGNVRYVSNDAVLPALNLAQSYLDYVKANDDPALEVLAALNNGQQDFVVQPVPEPGTLLLLGGSLCALAVRRRRKS